MVAERVARSLGLLCLATSVLGCGVGSDDTGSTPVIVAAVGANGLAANGLAANGLAANGLAANGLAANGLAANGLAANGLAASGLLGDGSTATDPATLQVLKYIVSCALGPQQRLVFSASGTTYSFPGQLGLAPQWGGEHGSCDGSCQRWVSACVLARVDAAGIEREISLRGPHVALLPTRSELEGYTQREATYFGNLFIPGQPRYLCLAPGQTEDERVCGDSLSGCPMTVVGSCTKDCAFAGPFGAFDFCSDSGRPGKGQLYFESVTVYLPK